ncbi:Predicted neuraminidase (sialidase) [Pseudarcicella hirudinis]|uniref:Predicted neuraminidase (Sialidase) n=1 Tax=Pseudarcicella hirudinis TaxID=1079859 RepID=A0A1I5PBP5_9BACT|nr:sialidase family protein [Pseudarcicella hirudinis]SFP31522.1 Predicted neuraminidase (sialidase) [Pseudarcicella hirudinis]
MSQKIVFQCRVKFNILMLSGIFLLPFQNFAQKLSEIKAQAVKNELMLNNPPFAACHASTLTELSDKSIMASWFAGAYEGSRDVCIWISVLRNGKWSEPQKVGDGQIDENTRYPCWNPVLFKTKKGRLFLFYKIGKNPREWWGMKMSSDDDGKTWSKPEKLPEGILGPIKNKPVQLADGAILYPSSTESLDEKLWHIHLEKSDEEAGNWRKIPIACDTFGVIQPSILSYAGHKLQLLCRSRQNRVVQTWSTDNGKHWEPLSLTELPNPNSGTDAVTLKNGLQVLVYNPLQKGKEWFNGRYKLNVAVSKNGKDWKDVYVLEDNKEGEYSYPAIIQSKDGLVHISYTADRKNIRYVQLKIGQ